MNEVIFYFYLVDLVHGIGGTLLIGMFACWAAAFAYFMYKADVTRYDEFVFPKLSKQLIVLGVVFLLIGTVLPSRDTMKLIAVTKAGEFVATETSLGKKSVEAIEVLLDEVIQRGKK